MEQDENFSDDSQENLRIENEILRIKLRAQYGDSFYMETNEGMPPEIENQFLKSMMAFEEEYANTEYTTVYERIGKPIMSRIEELTDIEIKNALKKINLLLQKNDITLHINDGPYPDALIYRFITEELFDQKVEKKPVAGMDVNFIYEEFYPNHKADILKRTHTFLLHWFKRDFNEYCTELSWHCTTTEGLHLTREDIIQKMKIFFEAFDKFKNNDYTISNTDFDLLDDNQRGMGFAEGMLKYDAVLENGEFLHYEGPFKLYMQMDDKWWSIFYFVVPGFKW